MAESAATGTARSWTAPHDVYVDGVLHPAGARFTTAAPRGAAWVAAEGPVRSRAARGPVPGGVTGALLPVPPLFMFGLPRPPG